ncbi:hypothetical protein CDAR_450811 [Caerostris darwini]|uniref:Uncharacterized protein n=1 Tax=Caerostris darwini TaxID=1538125 RepID=A0AAV4V830_9ARAC|nr:hypothetical protein CDAR_450811 [Caerostris darwini]
MAKLGFTDLKSRKEGQKNQKSGNRRKLQSREYRKKEKAVEARQFLSIVERNKMARNSNDAFLQQNNRRRCNKKKFELLSSLLGYYVTLTSIISAFNKLLCIQGDPLLL